MKILLAIDDDAASYEAALVVADWFPADASVVALHVGSVVAALPTTTPPVTLAGGLYPVYAVSEIRAQHSEIHKKARDIAQQAAELTDGQMRTEEGDPAEKIVEVAEEIGADLIVVGTGDRSWLSRLLSPSVSTTVIAKAPCSVLVVRPGDSS